MGAGRLLFPVSLLPAHILQGIPMNIARPLRDSPLSGYPLRHFNETLQPPKRCRTIATSSNFGETTLQTNTGYGMSQRPLCCYYLQGRCTFGFKCRFTHAEKAALATHPCQFGLTCRVG